GATQALADLDVTASTISLNAATFNVNDQGGNPATFTGAVSLDANVTVSADGATDNSLHFTSTVDADAAANNRVLTLTADSGDVTLDGAVGGAQALRRFNIGSADNVSLNAVTTQGGTGTNTINIGSAAPITGTIT